MAKITPQDMQEMLEALQTMEAGQAIQKMIEIAKAAMAGESQSTQQAALRELMRRLASGGGLGPNEGRAQGGEAPRGPDDGRDMDDERLRGKLDPKGNLGQKIPFKGIPRFEEAKAQFHETIGRAVDDAEESLGRDELPARSREFVRRYFDSLAKDKD